MISLFLGESTPVTITLQVIDQNNYEEQDTIEQVKRHISKVFFFV